MTLSNRIPPTVARRPRRSFLLLAVGGLLAVLLAAPDAATAQGLIQFSVSAGTSTRYQVGDDGTNRQVLDFPQALSNRSFATTRSDYWDGTRHVGRQYLYVQHYGDTSSGDLRVWSQETRQSKAITNFPSPYAVSFQAPLWSNDGLDSFISFHMVNRATGDSWLCRSLVSAADIASASFPPITLADLGTPRLQRLTDWTSTYWWNHDGSGFYYLEPGNGARIRAKTVGVGVTVADDPVVFVAPEGLSDLRVIPPVDPLNPVSDRYLVTWAASGILAIDLETSTSWWLAKPAVTKSNKNSFYSVRGPCFSPDGLMIAFGANRTDDAQTPYFGVYKVPFFGGQFARVTEVKGTKPNGGYYVTVSNWNTP